LESHEEEPEITLEEEIRMLQEQGLPAEKIAERILEEDFNADIHTLANTLKLDILAIGRIKGRISRLRKRRAEKEAPTPPTEEKPREEPLYKGELDTTAILRDILTHYPDIPEKVVNEVCSWAEYGPIHPTQLVSLLQSFRGITATTAYIVSQKYSLALQKAQLEGKLQVPPLIGGPMPGTSQPSWGLPTGFPQQPQPPTGLAQQPSTGYVPPFGVPPPAQTPGWGYPPLLTEEKVRSIIREERQAKEPRESEQYVEIEDPVRDNTGNVILDPQDRPIVKKMRVPASQASQLIPKEDLELKVLEKLGKYRELFKGELSEEKIREIIKEELPPAQPTAPSEKPITLEDVKKASSDAAQSAVTQVLEAHEKEDKEERRHQETLTAIRASGSAKTVEGYKEDSYRIMGQGLSEVARVVSERKPVEVIIREGGPLILGERPPKEVEAGAGKGLIDRLKERGWVVEQ